ncbi:sigma-K processing regulatory protein BofA [Carboxydothermus islandicus]|uniref:Sigma-K processing regulatory protein BofA n=1 Tax=Carboxydothermus islandicus TaxID=661089 RepID=A0A1L8CYW5_9THEO|nr:pro-sigmaK processing inhibitor BofA family protein [Carboxydothermus islandicus]GAV24110.1 sigma-K processing regulatory protein BofA [Carboxydothermus islandicus]
MELLGLVLKKILFWFVIGFILLGVFNLIGDKIGWHIPINPVTVVIVGVLDLPGIILLTAFRYLVTVF